VNEAVAECKRRFKNLPERHFASVALLVRQHLSSIEGVPEGK